MQTKPLIHCASTKGIMIKLMLCVIAVLSLAMFIPQEVEAGGGCTDCTCSPGDPGRDAWSFDNDYTWACSNRGKCEIWCGGHRYDTGPGTDNDVWDDRVGWTFDGYADDWWDGEPFFCKHIRYHHRKFHLRCSICGQIIGWDQTDEEEVHEPVLETVLFRNPKDPCQVMWMSSCIFCKQIEDGGLFGWSHIEYQPGQVFNDNPFLVPTTNETGEANNIWMMDCDGCGGSAVTAQALTNVNNEEAHAIWCGHHWYVNHENCDDSVKNKLNLGEYIGDYFYGTPGNPSGQRQDGLLHMYGHELQLVGNNTLQCSICGHTRPIGSMTLLSRRTDNDAIIGYSDFRKGVPPTAEKAPWTNSDVTFDHNAPGGVSTSHNIWNWQRWGLMLDGSDRGSGRTTLSQEGTHEVYTKEGYQHREERYVRVGTGHYTDSEGKSHSYAIYGWRWFNCCYPYGNSGHPAPGKAQAATHYVKIDKTAPKSTPTVTTGAYKTPISKLENDDGTFNSEAYGMKINLSADDSNPNARGGKTDVAKIFLAYVEVVPVDGDGRQVTNLQKTYDLGQNTNGVVTADQGVSWLPGVLTINTTNVIDVNKDFPEYLDFHYKIHVIDCAGNDAVTEGDIVRQPEVFTNIQNISNNKELRKTNSFIGGEHGVLRIITTGYVDDSTLNWNEFTLGASECDRSHEYPTMVYNQILQMKPYTTETSGFRLAQKGEYYPLLEPMASYTPDGGYTRIYEFVFWTPFNHGWQNEDGSMPYKSPSDQYSVKTVGWNKRYNRVGNAKTYYKIGADKITDKFRTSLVF